MKDSIKHTAHHIKHAGKCEERIVRVSCYNAAHLLIDRIEEEFDVKATIRRTNGTIFLTFRANDWYNTRIIWYVFGFDAAYRDDNEQAVNQ